MIFKDSLLLWLQILDCVLSCISSPSVVSGLLSVIFYFHFFILQSVNTHLFAFIVLPLSQNSLRFLFGA